MTSRVGLGFDSHAFVAGRPLVLGGVAIPSEKGLAGHSDADVLAHAVTDAVLGAVGAPDIGELFPDSDGKFKNADSLKLLSSAMNEVAKAGWCIVNIDAVVICDHPRIGPHKEAMIANLASALGVSPDQINVKGKSAEGMAPFDGVMAQAVALLEKNR